MRTETVTSPPTLGAARVLSYTFPALGTQSAAGSQPNGRDAQSGRPYGRINDINTGAVGLNITTTGAPPAGDGLQIYRNRVTYAITSNTVPTGRIVTSNFGTNQPWVVPFQETAAADDVSGADDMHVWEFSAILAFDALPGVVTGDIGMTLGVGTRAEIRGAAAFAGIELGPSDVGVLSLIARQADAGAITLNQQISNTIDMTVFHRYALRIVGAATSDALLRVLVDGQVKTTVPWGAGTVLPSQVVGGAGNLGFTPSYLNKAACAAGTARMYVAARGCTVCAAPTEDALA